MAAKDKSEPPVLQLSGAFHDNSHREPKQHRIGAAAAFVVPERTETQTDIKTWTRRDVIFVRRPVLENEWRLTMAWERRLCSFGAGSNRGGGQSEKPGGSTGQPAPKARRKRSMSGTDPRGRPKAQRPAAAPWPLVERRGRSGLPANRGAPGKQRRGGGGILCRKPHKEQRGNPAKIPAEPGIPKNKEKKRMALLDCYEEFYITPCCASGLFVRKASSWVALICNHGY